MGTTGRPAAGTSVRKSEGSGFPGTGDRERRPHGPGAADGFVRPGGENPVLSVRKLSFWYPGGEEPALRAVDLAVGQGEFFVLCGPSGCGKSTLLRLIKRSLAPHGRLQGEIFWEGRPLSGLSRREEAAAVGFVQQSPESQIVTDTVWHELAFGLESLGLPSSSIRRRAAETASFFGIEGWFHTKTAELSGGQKQLLNLASVMAMRPRLLILDEPTAQLDPIAASRFLELLGRINRELGAAVLLAEHRLEEALPLADRCGVMEEGRILCGGPPGKLGSLLRGRDGKALLGMPAAMRIWAAVEPAAPDSCGEEGCCPVTVGEGRAWLRDFVRTHPLLCGEGAARQVSFSEKTEGRGEEILRAQDLWFAYERGAEPVVRGLSLSLQRGELLAVLGGNGAGKTTLLRLLSSGLRPQRGSVDCSGRVGMLPQDPKLLFAKKTLWEDMLDALDSTDAADALKRRGGPGEEGERRARKALRLCGLEGLAERHPYDLSGGEQQRAALAKVLLCEPDILLLDEPTKGFDACWKREFAGLLRSLLRKGTAVLMVSHDMDFCAETADRCALFFDGSIAAQGAPEEFFSGGSYYTTAAARIGEGFVPGAVTVEAVAAACGAFPADGPKTSGDISDIDNIGDVEGLAGLGGSGVPAVSEALGAAGSSWPGDAPGGKLREGMGESREKKEEKRGLSRLPLWRKLLAGASGFAAAAAFLRAVGETELSALSAPSSPSSAGDLGSGAGFMSQAQLWNTVFLLVSLAVLAAAVFRREKTGAVLTPFPRGRAQRRGIPRRTAAAAVFVLLLIPLTLLWGVFLLDNRKYAFIALLVLLECMAPFFLVFEGRKPRARELAVIAVLCAAGTAGRAAFFMLPQCKPVLALTVLSGAALGGETGFLVGAATMLASNMFFSQGPLTPWQMFAMGLTGFLAGALFFRRSGSGLRKLQASRLSLCVYGALSALVLYGGIMNAASALTWQSQVDWSILLAYIASGFPMDCIHAGATVLFLWFGAEPVLEKLERLRTKYGLLE